MITNQEGDTALSLSGRYVTLKPVTTESYSWLYQIAVSEKVGWRWRLRGSTPSPERFAQFLWNDVLAQFIVARTSDRVPVGLVQGYRADHGGQHCYLAVLLAPDMIGLGWPLEGVSILTEYLFQNWNFRKIYVEAHSFNLNQFGSLATDLFVEEGRLVGHTPCGGDFYDLVTLALYRDQWERSAHCRRLRGLDAATSLDRRLRPVSEVLVSEFAVPRESISASARLQEDLGLDSLHLLELFEILEDRLSVEISDFSFATVGELEAALLGMPSR